MVSAETNPLTASMIRSGLCLIVFLQYNDALLEFFRPVPLFNIISAVTAVIIVFSMKHPDMRMRASDAWIVLVPMVGLMVLSAFSHLYAINPDKALEDTVRMMKISLMVLILAYGVRSVRDLMVVIHCFIIASIALGAFMLLEALNGAPLLDVERHEETLDLFDGFFRSSGLSMESPPMAATLVLCGAAMSAVLFVRRERQRVFYGFGFFVSGAAVLISLTRSATLSLILVILILVWRLRRRRSFPWIVLSVLSIFLISSLLLPPEVWSKLRIMFDTSQDQTVLRRLSYQIIGWDLFVHNPVFGVGSGNFNEHYASAEYRFVPGRGDEPRPLHNLYLQYLSELGILGFALFVCLIGAVGHTLGGVAAQARSSELRILADVLLLGFISSLFQLFFVSSNFLFSFWAIVGLTVAVVYLERRAPKTDQSVPDQGLTGPEGSPITPR